MPTPDISYNWQGRNSLEARIAALANEDGPFLPRDAFRNRVFIRNLNQNTTPDRTIAALFTELDVVETDPTKKPVDIYLFGKHKEYDEQLKTLSRQEVDELAFARAALITATSSYARAFRQFRETIDDLSPSANFFAIPLDKAEAFGGFVIEQVLSGNDEVHSTGSD